MMYRRVLLSMRCLVSWTSALARSGRILVNNAGLVPDKPHDQVRRNKRYAQLKTLCQLFPIGQSLLGMAIIGS